jgi:hypothetical protein
MTLPADATILGSRPMSRLVVDGIIEVKDAEPYETTDGCNICNRAEVVKVLIVGREVAATRVRFCSICFERLVQTIESAVFVAEDEDGRVEREERLNRIATVYPEAAAEARALWTSDRSK